MNPVRNIFKYTNKEKRFSERVSNGVKKFLATILCVATVVALNGIPFRALAATPPYTYGYDSGGNALWFFPDTGVTERLPVGQSPNTAPTTPTPGLTAPTNISGSVSESDLNAGTQTTNADGSATSDSGDTGAQNASGATAGCQSDNMGGSLGGVGSQLLGSLVHQLLPGAAGGAANQILQSLFTGGKTNINVAGMISQFGGQSSGLINTVLGMTGFGNKINGFVNNLFSGGGFSKIFGGGSSASGLVSSLTGPSAVDFASLAAGNLPSLAGSAFGLVEGVLGGLPIPGIGAGPVPVDPVTSNPLLKTGNEQTLQIQRDQDTQLQVICVNNVLVSAASHQFAANFSQTTLNALNTGNGGWSFYQHGYPSEQNFVQDSAANYWASQIGKLGGNPVFTAGAQRYFTDLYTNSSQVDLSCPVSGGINSQACSEDRRQCGSTEKEKQANYFIVETHHGCTQAGTNRAVTFAGFNYVGGRQAEQTNLNQQAGGYLPKIQCLKPENYTGPSQGCQAWLVVTPAGGVQNAANTATNVGAEQQARADQIGELVDSLLANLASQALTSLTGMIGLSQSHNGQSSYLNRVAGNTNTTTFAQAKAALQGDIESSIGVEVAYEGVLNGMIANLQSEKTAFSAKASCYAALPLTTIGSTTSQVLGTQASTTITAVIAPLIDQKNTQISDSENVISQLNAYDTQVQSAQTIAEINALSRAYQALVSSGALHTTSDVTLALAERDASKATMNTLLFGISSTQCPFN